MPVFLLIEIGDALGSVLAVLDAKASVKADGEAVVVAIVFVAHDEEFV
jgi:hypothetical protein